MTVWSARAFRVVLVAIGAFIVFIGINVGFGGIVTLGWQGPTRFFEITNEHDYLIRDSHVRFFGGLFGGIGLFLLLAATDPPRYRAPLSLVFVVLFIGGLARLTMPRLEVILGPDLIVATVGELVLMPILLLWLRALPVASAAARRSRPARW